MHCIPKGTILIFGLPNSIDFAYSAVFAIFLESVTLNM